jgi:hypothetical protein
VVKTYGRDAFLVLWNPVVAGLMVTLGLRVGLWSDAQLLDRMERDSLAMTERGYRVTSSDEFVVPVLWPGASTNYYRVTYELDPETRRLQGS